MAKPIEMSEGEIDKVSMYLAAGDTWGQIGYKMGKSQAAIKRAAKLRGLKQGRRPHVAFVSMSPESGQFLARDDPGAVIKFNSSDPEGVLIGVRDKLITVVSGIEQKIMDREAGYMDKQDDVSRFAQEAATEGYGVREYVSILKDIAKLAQAHMPYRHATLSAVAIKDMDKSTGIKGQSREEKRKRLTNLLEQAGVLDVAS